MPVIPAQCTNPECGAIFPSGIVVENAIDVRITGLTRQCPRCGSIALVADGHFDITTDTIEVISASGFTLDMLQAVKASLEKAKAGIISAEEAADQIIHIAPLLASALNHAKNNEVLFTLLLSIITLAISLWDIHSNNDFQDQLLRLLEKSPSYSERDASQDDTSAQPHKKSVPDKSAGKHKSKDRRALVNAQRRAELKTHRIAFGGASLREEFRHKPDTSPSQ